MSDVWRKQAANILRLLDDLPFDSVYELGVGEGRIAEPILETRDCTRYDSCDLSPIRRDTVTERLREKYPHFNCKMESFQSAEIQHQYDMMLAVECLMHVKPDELGGVMRKMVKHARKYCVNVDYWEPTPAADMAPHNFAHDYESAYRSLGLVCRRIELPYKQAMFVTKM